MVDVKHDVDQRPVPSVERKLNTIVAQAGLVFLPELDVWSTGLDGRTRVRELGECEALPRRWFTPTELCHRCGNTMHLNLVSRESCVVLGLAVLR